MNTKKIILILSLAFSIVPITSTIAVTPVTAQSNEAAAGLLSNKAVLVSVAAALGATSVGLALTPASRAKIKRALGRFGILGKQAKARTISASASDVAWTAATFLSALAAAGVGGYAVKKHFQSSANTNNAKQTASGSSNDSTQVIQSIPVDVTKKHSELLLLSAEQAAGFDKTGRNLRHAKGDTMAHILKQFETSGARVYRGMTPEEAMAEKAKEERKLKEKKAYYGDPFFLDHFFA